MTNVDKTQPIRDLLGALAGTPTPRPTRCGGAIVAVTRDTYQALARMLDVDFADGLDELPSDGTRASVRVACNEDVLEAHGVGGAIQYATCARCAGIERRLREVLAEAAARAPR